MPNYIGYIEEASGQIFVLFCEIETINNKIAF